jgi:hypothetical protein
MAKVGRPRIEFTPEQLAGMAQRYRDGEALMWLSIDYGVSQDVVSHLLRENGVEIRKPYERRMKKGWP